MVKKRSLTPERTNRGITKNKTKEVDTVPTQTQKEAGTHKVAIAAEATSGHQFVKDGTHNNRAEVEYPVERAGGHEVTPQGLKYRVRS